jgi:hypothetical protein
MGRLIYGAGCEFEIDDRTLAHLQIVMVAKLRRSEHFALSWSGESRREGRSTVWVSPSQYLQFLYEDGPAVVINRQWVDELMAAANSVGGLHPVPEPMATTAVTQPA